jgi:hypothetical protein
VTDALPLWLKLAYTAFLAVIVPVYWVKNGPANFLWFSDIAMFATGAALWLENSFIASTMLVGVLLLELVWNVSFFGRLLFGVRITPLADYMFERGKSLVIRVLSFLLHVFMPACLIWIIHVLGYDDRALLAQTLLAWLVLPVTYLITQPEKNINWVFGPGKPQTRLSPVAYLGLLMVVMPIGIYVPTHLLLRALF